MPVERPTFSESWYRVAALKPTLRTIVQVHRQHFRGQMWHVLQDPANNQFFRLNESAYAFIAMLDGRKTVAEVWDKCNELLGDAAPTQGEVIQLLGQLYSANLIRAELPPDAESLFRKYDKRVKREIQSYLMNLLFIRIPIYDPDKLLDRWVGVVGKLFTLPGLIIWLALILTGLYSIMGRAGELVGSSQNVLDPANLAYLYVAMVLVKVFHEFGHAFSCKKFGEGAGGGEVHVMGIMFLIFTPLPYVDATSSWAFREKWHRAIVGAAGMIVELAIASIAAVIWANTSPGPLHAITFNMIFVAGFSTLLFNANPLLRYDGYYIMSDLLEIPNLAQRSKTYIYYLVRKYVWGVKRAQNPAHTRGEKVWFTIYGLASTAYRFFISFRILIFIAEQYPFIGGILAVTALVGWVLVPIGQFIHYLTSSGELDRVRWRAIGTTFIFFAALGFCIGGINWSNTERVEGVAEPRQLVLVHAQADGFLRKIEADSGAKVKEGDPLLVTENPLYTSVLRQLNAEKNRLTVEQWQAEQKDLPKAQAIAEQIKALDERIAFSEKERNWLIIRAPISGMWVSPGVDRLIDGYISRGDRVGLIAGSDELIIRAIGNQDVATELYSRGVKSVEFRLKGKPDNVYSGRITKTFQAGSRNLPSPALGYMSGGSVQTAATDKNGTKATESFFEIQIEPINCSELRSGQRVIVRLELESEPLVIQWWRELLRLFQRRLQI